MSAADETKKSKHSHLKLQTSSVEDGLHLLQQDPSISSGKNTITNKEEKLHYVGTTSYRPSPKNQQLLDNQATKINPKEITTSKQIFQETQQARDLMEQLPIKFKKKLRQVLQIYKKQRMEDKMEIRRLNKSRQNIDYYQYLRGSSQKSVQVNSSRQYLNDFLSTPQQNGQTSFYESLYEPETWFNNQEQVIKMNQFVQFISEGFQHERTNLNHQIEELKSLVSDKNGQINKYKKLSQQLKKQMNSLREEVSHSAAELTKTKEKQKQLQMIINDWNNSPNEVSQVDQLKCQLIFKNEQISKYQDIIQEMSRQIHSQKDKIQKYDIQLKKLEDKQKQYDNLKIQNDKSNFQNRQYLQIGNNLENISLEEPKRSNPMLTVNTAIKKRKQSHSRSPNSPDRHSARSRKISLRQQISNPRDSFFNKNQEQQPVHSECDSVQFGKEKVIEKRKVRKIFSNLISASTNGQKREALQKLSLEIGIKIKDYDIVFNSSSQS